MLDSQKRAYVAQAGGKEIFLLPGMANRHGLITGATGTGKTVTLQNLAESFSAMGVPVFMTDIKGDLSGIVAPGNPTGKIAARVSDLELESKGYRNQGYPTVFWDVFGEQGHPLRTTISEMGPMLLSRLLELNDVQSGIMNLIFRIADDEGLLLLDLKDLRLMAQYVGDHRAEYTLEYGNISPSSIGAIQRSLLQLEGQGGDLFFGEPAFDIRDFFQTDFDGRGFVNILAADKLMNAPRIYSTVLLWLLSELYEQLPEVGDADKPRLVFFFDEAHMLFRDVPKVLLEKIEQLVRLIRSKGVGVFFITQNPADIPDTVLAQLGNKVQHALRAYTPKEQKAVRVVAESFRPNPAFRTEAVITELGVGEALVSFLDAKGIPQMVERAYILPPQGQVGPVSAEKREEVMRHSRSGSRYDTMVDRESAYELLTERIKAVYKAEADLKAAKDAAKQAREDEKARAAEERARLAEERAQEKLRREQERAEAAALRAHEKALREEEKAREKAEREAEKARRSSFTYGVGKSIERNVKNTISREVTKGGVKILRGLLGGLFGGR